MGDKNTGRVVAKLDRLRVISWARPYWNIRPIRGFRVVRDTRVKAQGNTPTYERVRELASLTSKTRVWWQYRPRRGWLKAWRITWVADDKMGIQPLEILQILKGCRFFRFVLVELALDFSPNCGVDRRFVKRHGRFGKSRRRTDRGGPEQLRYGSRRSGKLVRCYAKKQINAFRVELELHSQLLAKNTHAKDKNYNLAQVPNRILPHHIRTHVIFVRFKWQALKRYLIHRFGARGESLLQDARSKARLSLHNVTRFLRRQHIPNVHRFLVPMSINSKVGAAITQWEMKFEADWRRVL